MKNLGSALQQKTRAFMRPVVRSLLYFFYETHYTVGSSGKLFLGEKVAVANTLFNLSSGSIYVGNKTIFGHNVMVLTGRHNFYEGRRASLIPGFESSSWGGGDEEVPPLGYDIHIGEGTWIASGVIIIGGVTVGHNAIVAAGAVVTRNVPDYAVVAGIPARVVGDTRDMKQA
jgi:acetyltransferase-like isoleucine patch superfamily enzyme